MIKKSILVISAVVSYFVLSPILVISAADNKNNKILHKDLSRKGFSKENIHPHADGLKSKKLFSDPIFSSCQELRMPNKSDIKMYGKGNYTFEFKQVLSHKTTCFKDCSEKLMKLCLVSYSREDIHVAKNGRKFKLRKGLNPVMSNCYQSCICQVDPLVYHGGHTGIVKACLLIEKRNIKKLKNKLKRKKLSSIRNKIKEEITKNNVTIKRYEDYLKSQNKTKTKTKTS